MDSSSERRENDFDISNMHLLQFARTHVHHHKNQNQ